MRYRIQNRQDDNVSMIVEGDTWIDIAEAIADCFDYALILFDDVGEENEDE